MHNEPLKNFIAHARSKGYALMQDDGRVLMPDGSFVQPKAQP